LRETENFMKHQLDVGTLATLVRTKRAGRGLREVADEIGEVSPSTLSRVENEKAPDLTTFLRICDWLQVPPAQLLLNEEVVAEGKATDTSEKIALLLRSDSQLDPATANALAAIIKATYQTLPKQTDGRRD
jgi:transcriptional regulator with XRE-family HTH domain